MCEQEVWVQAVMRAYMAKLGLGDWTDAHLQWADEALVHCQIRLAREGGDAESLAHFVRVAVPTLAYGYAVASWIGGQTPAWRRHCLWNLVYDAWQHGAPDLQWEAALRAKVIELHSFR